MSATLPDCLSEDKLSALVNQTLVGEERERVAKHLVECEGCRNIASALRHSTARPRDEETIDVAAPIRAGDTHASQAGLSINPNPRPIAQPGDITRTDRSSSGSSRGGSSSGASSGNSRGQAVANLHTVEDVQTNLSLSGLMSQLELSSFVGALPPEEQPKDAAALIEALLRHKKLTPFQASALRSGKVFGLVLGNYVVSDKLGQGGMGVVFKAVHKRMKRTVAIKLLPPNLLDSPDVLARFHREVEAAAKLTHSNIAAAYDADEADGIHFLVMEHVDGPTLSAYVKHAGRMPIGAAVNLTLQAARGLAHAHHEGVIHRDIKPSNLLVNREGALKILDMGLARFSEVGGEQVERDDLTHSGRVMGTVDYMAPEQALDAKKADHRADIYSLGCTLYFLLIGQSPVPEGTFTQKLLWHQTAEAPSARAVRPEVPEELDAILMKMLARKQLERYQSMQEVCEQLEGVLAKIPADEQKLALEGMDLIVRAPHSEPGVSWGPSRAAAVTMAAPTQTDLPPQPKPRSMLPIYVGLGAAACVGIVGFTLFLMQPPKKQDAPPAPPIALTPPPVQPPATALATARPEPDPLPMPVKPVTVELPIPHAKLLGWVFQNGGSATVVTDGGTVIQVSKLEEVPRKGFDFLMLKLDGTSVQDAELSKLGEVEKLLQELSLADTQLTDKALEHLARLRELRNLNLSRTKITNDGLAKVARLSELRDLNLQSTGINDQGLTPLLALERLEKLYLSDTSIGDAGMKKLENLASLKEIGLNGTFVTEEAYNSLVAAIPGIKVHWDGKDLERNAAHKMLAKGAALDVVTRSGQVAAAIKDKLNLPRERFQVLSVDATGNGKVTDDDLKSLAELAKIETLKIGGTNVTAAGLSRLQGLATLKHLDLGTLAIPKSAVDTLQSAIKDCEIKQRPPGDVVVAEWVLAQKGAVTIVTPDGDLVPEIRQVAALPKGAYTVRQIQLDGNKGVTNETLGQLRELNNLEGLYLTGTSITDEGLPILSDCSSLRDLSLGETKITSRGLTQLQRLSNLQRLVLADTAVDGEGVKQVARLDNLTHLTLANTKLKDEDLVPFKRLAKLTRLSLTGIPLTDAALPHLKALTQVKELLVDGTQLTDAGVEELKTALMQCKITADPPNPGRTIARWVLQQGGSVTTDSGELLKLSQLPRTGLKVLKIDLTDVTNVKPTTLVDRLRGCTDLEELDVSGIPVTNEQLVTFATLTNLKSLVLSGAPVTDVGVARLTPLTQLTKLDLRGTRVNGTSFEALKELTSLSQILVGNCQVSDRNVVQLASFPNLVSLDLSGNVQISDKGVKELKALPNMQWLSLRGTHVTDAGMAIVAGFKDLKIIDVEGTEVTDAGAANLKGCTKLTVVNLNRTQVSDSTLAMLAAMKDLKTVSVLRTRVTNGGVATLKQALPKCNVAFTPEAPRPNDGNNPTGSPAPFGSGTPGSGRP